MAAFRVFVQFVVRFGLIWYTVAEKCLEKCMIFMLQVQRCIHDFHLAFLHA